MIKTQGIHHVSSVVGHAQKDVDFNAGVLGLRLVKKTLNFDDKESYHFYYGNMDGSSGLVTTFPQEDSYQGSVGLGQVGTVTYGIPTNTMDAWKQRLESFNILVQDINQYGTRHLAFLDPSGLELELVETNKGPINEWEFNGVDRNHALKGIFGATLFSRSYIETDTLLTTVLGYQKIDEDNETLSYQIHDDLGGSLRLSKVNRPNGRGGVGTVHHIAFKIKEADLQAWIERLKEYGYKPTPIRDRKYFKSIYFREHGGILIELATEGPGVLVDEPLESLGTTFKVPPHFEGQVDLSKSNLMPVEVREVSQLENYGYRNKCELKLLHQKQALKRHIKAYIDIKKKRDLTPDELKRLETLQKEYLNLSKGDNSHE